MSFWEAAKALDDSGSSFVVVTLVASRGHAPQDEGAKAIMTLDGLKWGTIGGGKVEARALDRARELLSSPSNKNGVFQAELVTWNLQRDIGMTCGGEVTYLFEVFRKDPWKIVIFGAGHVAQALVRALEPLSCQVTCIDPRPEWIERIPNSRKIQALCIQEPASEVARLDPSSYFVVMTQGHATDMPILEMLLKTFPYAPYLGSIGSDIKALKIKNELKARGIEPQLIERLHCPIGLPLGSNAPAEISISIIAQLLQVRDKRARKA